MTDLGKIILLNGASSAGKSSLAKAIQARIGEPFWHVSSDQFVAAQMLPPRRQGNGDFDWRVMRPRFFAAFHCCLPAIACAGNNLVVDHVIEFQAWMDELADLLIKYDVFFVGVHCPLDELERREQARGDRRIGEAREHLKVVHTFGPYDYELDSPSVSPDQNAAQLISAWQSRATPSAFQRMTDTRGDGRRRNG